jgi:hypothetical protein
MIVSESQYPSAEHALRWLPLGHYLYALILALVAGVCMYFGSLLVIAGPMEDENGYGPPFPGIFVACGALIVIVSGAGLALAVGSGISGVGIAKRRFMTFSRFIAWLNCLAFPFGTVLGVWTLDVLGQASVKALYPQGSNPQLTTQ